MENISVFDMLKIGVGPSSSHTLGPWKAAERWISELQETGVFDKIERIKVDLYGSLSLTGKGHYTDVATVLGLNGDDPRTIPTDNINDIIDNIRIEKKINFGDKRELRFDIDNDIIFNREFLKYHPNGMKFTAYYGGLEVETYFYSIGGGFVIKENEKLSTQSKSLPFPIDKAVDLLKHCKTTGKSISEIVMENELSWQAKEEVEIDAMKIWAVMQDCVYDGCHTEGILPGGLNVRRRASIIYKSLIGDSTYSSRSEWMQVIKEKGSDNQDIFSWISLFALAVNEVNASLGRVVTSPTNGSSGVIPAVLMYYLTGVNKDATSDDIVKFLLVAGEIGSIFKKGATISAAMGGCQAEIGVSSAMAAAALTELKGGTPEQATEAAEIAMEHHLGLTCDPIGGLVQIPCIERNTMGAIKAITASQLAMSTDPSDAKVTLDEVVKTMFDTAKDMHSKYKETSEGGLAINVPVSLPAC
ncbi:MAG: L-serine ammonia-lyase [Flavobacteriales bacterium]|nr:L-serine ammonia-lyase [Flavobacteriales bacterium]